MFRFECRNADSPDWVVIWMLKVQCQAMCLFGTQTTQRNENEKYSGQPAAFFVTTAGVDVPCARPLILSSIFFTNVNNITCTIVVRTLVWCSKPAADAATSIKVNQDWKGVICTRIHTCVLRKLWRLLAEMHFKEQLLIQDYGMNMSVFWVVAACNLVEVCRLSEVLAASISRAQPNQTQTTLTWPDNLTQTTQHNLPFRTKSDPTWPDLVMTLHYFFIVLYPFNIFSLCHFTSSLFHFYFVISSLSHHNLISPYLTFPNPT
jgi:hypothetical protein